MQSMLPLYVALQGLGNNEMTGTTRQSTGLLVLERKNLPCSSYNSVQSVQS